LGRCHVSRHNSVKSTFLRKTAPTITVTSLHNGEPLETAAMVLSSFSVYTCSLSRPPELTQFSYPHCTPIPSVHPPTMSYSVQIHIGGHCYYF
jgi:hypothetical protein